ncbi:defensin-like protein 1 [Solanum pennellii]|uniref:Defensin-like protein 1 n=1 Tax=Solanum pennellii TaxID=28526 RepID=A0ABM1H8J7_SOLPN|nr:defensin-like protein 1 [Solanum pennellii]
MNSKVILALLVCFLLIASNEMQGGEAKVCGRRSSTWSGLCLNTGNCNTQCIKWEHASSGACHRDGFGFACFCYFNC